MYKKAYSALFNQITDTLHVLDEERLKVIETAYKIKAECKRLKLAQRAVEEYIIESEEKICEDESENADFCGNG